MSDIATDKLLVLYPHARLQSNNQSIKYLTCCCVVD